MNAFAGYDNWLATNPNERMEAAYEAAAEALYGDPDFTPCANTGCTTDEACQTCCDAWLAEQEGPDAEPDDHFYDPGDHDDRLDP